MVKCRIIVEDFSGKSEEETEMDNKRDDTVDNCEKPMTRCLDRESDGLKEENGAVDSLTPRTSGADVDDTVSLLSSELQDFLSEEESDEEPEMKPDEKMRMYECVCRGDIPLLDDLLDLPAADINMIWFGENLLMAAIRQGQEAMAEFLIDNGIDWNYAAIHLDKREFCAKENIPDIDWYSLTCRQLAYELNMGNIVDLIDEMNGNTWSFKPKRNRVIKKKKPLEEKIREQEERERQEREVLRAIEKMMGGGGIDSGRSSVDSLLDTPRTLKLLDDTTKGTGKSKKDSTSTSGYESNGSSDSAEVHPAPKLKYRNNKAYYSRKMQSRDRVQNKENVRPTPFPPKTPKCPSSLSQYPQDIQSIQHEEIHKLVSTPEHDLTRVVSPWKQDDPVYVAHLRSRAKSAFVHPGSPHHKPQKRVSPLESDKMVTRLPVLGDVVRTESTLYDKNHRQRSSKSAKGPSQQIGTHTAHKIPHSVFPSSYHKYTLRENTTKLTPDTRYVASLRQRASGRPGPSRSLLSARKLR